MRKRRVFIDSMLSIWVLVIFASFDIALLIIIVNYNVDEDIYVFFGLLTLFCLWMIKFIFPPKTKKRVLNKGLTQGELYERHAWVMLKSFGKPKKFFFFNEFDYDYVETGKEYYFYLRAASVVRVKDIPPPKQKRKKEI